MIQILAGEKGQGKTKRLIDMANEASKTIDGNVVFIDDDLIYFTAWIEEGVVNDKITYDYRYLKFVTMKFS